MTRRQLLGFLLLLAAPLGATALPLLPRPRPCWVVTHPAHRVGEYIALVNGRLIAVGLGCAELTNAEVQQLHNRGYTLYRRF